jgi:hypothetical protein
MIELKISMTQTLTALAYSRGRRVREMGSKEIR